MVQLSLVQIYLAQNSKQGRGIIIKQFLKNDGWWWWWSWRRMTFQTFTVYYYFFYF